MKKDKNNLLFATSLVSIIGMVAFMAFFTIAKAERDGEQDSEVRDNSNSTSTVRNEADNEDRNKVEADDNESATDEDKNTENDEFNSDEHLNKEKDFKRELLDIADKEDKDNDSEDGQEIRNIVKEQDETASTTAEAIDKIEHRSKIKTFFFGSDYKNLGTLRSNIVQTRNRLDQLDKIAEKLQNATGTAETIKAQSQALELELTKMENFIKDQEGKFSLFGWLVKLFSK